MLLLLPVIVPILGGILISVRKMEDAVRNRLYAGLILLTDLSALPALIAGGSVTLVTFSENVTLSFVLDPIGRYFLAAVLMLYTAVTFYAFEYMKMEERPHVFFAFFFVSLGALISVCMAGNLVTLYFCFEMATLTSMPLVLHEMSKDAVAAGLKYLFYSVAGALLGLLGVFFVYYYGTGSRAFVYGGFLDVSKMSGNQTVFLVVCFLAILGFGTKAGMYPMHGWLPTAHPIAPAPASALLSGIIAKAGVMAIIRLVYYSIGAEVLRGTWVQFAWMSLTMLTIFMGSMMAFREKVMKKRLAYSTISQISYILLGLSQLSSEGLQGGLLHLMGHAAAKGCLFLCAGVFIYKLGKRNVDDLRGVGKQMPVTMWCFTIASLSLVGIPPLAGFLSKWVIAMAAIQAGNGVFSILAPVILLVSALLTAGYLLPVVVNAFFPGEDFDVSSLKPAEPSRLMTVPMICLCCVMLIVGLFGTGLVGLLGV